ILCSIGRSSCCHPLASCECRIPSGHYACVCPDGYVGDGLVEECRPCPPRSYWSHSQTCTACPDINHVTLSIPAIGIENCICKPGFKRTADHRCEGITCPRLSPPDNGYFVTQPTTNANVLNAANGVRCKSGYHLLGSSLRLCQENGTWSGTEAQCVLKSCPSLPVPQNGMITCQNHDLELPSFDYTPQNDSFMEGYLDDSKRRTEPMPIDTECSYRCSPGHYIVGSKNRNCLPLSKWDGRQTTCKTVMCAPLPKPKFGYYEHSECTQGKQPYGTNCTLICPEGFTLKGAGTRVCSGKKNGFWTPKNKNSKCVDITPPKLVCPDNYTLELPPNNDSIFVISLPLPLEVQDSSSSSVKIWTKPSVDDATGVGLKIGHHTFTYYASDQFNNKAECNFRVTVLDRTPPSVENCVDSEEFWITTDNVTSKIEWEEPTFVDNSKEDVEIRVLTALDPRKMTTLVAGEYPILYTGQDRSKNYNECLLNITIKELTCDPLPSPQHGLSYCAKNTTHTWCEVSCDNGYAIYDDETEEYLDNFRISCDHKHPGWKYRTIPDCTKQDLPDAVGQSFTIELDSENPLCSNKESKETFISSLSDQMKTHLCNNQEGCSIISEIPECIEEEIEDDKIDDTPLGDREKYHISKREVPSGNRQKKNKKRIRLNVKIRLYTKISKRMGLWENNATLSENIRQMKYEFQRFNTNEPLKRALEDMQINVRRLKIEEFVRCPDGSVSKKNICVQCARGTYQDAALNSCKLCPLGTYNSQYAQNVCSRCPPHHTTRREGRLYQTDCKAECPPGTWAKLRQKPRRNSSGMTASHSFMPFCRKCAAGDYQPAYNQISCHQCPIGFTSPRGSTSLYDCSEKKLHICETQAKICGDFGKCIAEDGGDDLYSCICPGGYQGARCEHPIDLCHSGPCVNNGICAHLNETTITCQCPPEFTGKFCEELRNPCDVTVCQNGGTCIVSDDGEAVCECSSDFEGKLCEESVNYCDSMLCESGICQNKNNGYICICPPGIIGRRCHLRPCDNFPCHPNATCVDMMHFPATRGSYECKCPKGLRGYDCSEISNPCESSPCENNGICQAVALRGEPIPDGTILDDDVYEKFTCKCPPYFYGELCEIFTKPDFVMKFSKASTLNYVKMKGPDHDLSEFSFCTWIKTDDSFTYGAVLSYATKDNDNAFTLTDYSGFVLYVNGNSSGSDIVANDGEWHFLCASWTSENGYYELFFDGRLEHAGMNLSAGQHIPGDGIFIVGQEQDRLGGGFSESESFIGQIAYLEVWDTVITADQVNEFYRSCQPYRGSLYSWTDFKGKIHGGIEILPSNFCQDCRKDLQISNGFIRYKDNQALYFCNPGFIMRGSTTVRHCLRTSEWSYETPYCDVVDCGNLRPVENGRINYSSGTTLHSIAEYECSNGYAVDGNDKRVCLTMGVWSGQEPVCRSYVQCEKLILPENIHVVYASDKGIIQWEMDYYPVGVFAQVTCLLTSRDHFLTCMDDGEWDGSIPNCNQYPITSDVPETTTIPPSSSIATTISTTTPTPTSEKLITFDLIRPTSEFQKIDDLNLRTSTVNLEEDLKPDLESEITTKIPHSAPKLPTTEVDPTPMSVIKLTTEEPMLSTSPVQPLQNKTPYPYKDFWNLLYEFLYKGCLGESSTEVILCSQTTKPVYHSNLFISDQNNMEKYPNVDVQLLDLLERHSNDVLNETNGVPYEDFFDILIYGKNFANVTKMEPDFENAIRFVLCIFLDAIAWENKFDQKPPVEEDATALENRSGILKKLIRKLIVPVYEEYKRRFPEVKTTTPKAWEMSSTVDENNFDEIGEAEWTDDSNDETPGCDWSSLPDPPLGGVIVQYKFWENETISFGGAVEYGCGTNLQRIGRSWLSKCLENGQWSDIDYKCHLKWCYEPPLLRNMIVDSPSDHYRIGHIATVSCEPGFYLFKNNNTIECLPSGMWSRVQTWCARISCDIPSLPENAETVKGSSFLYEDTLSVKCGEDFYELTCDINGQWTSNLPEIC
ncbi:sushi, von Willebrand factor type A, EGF and pentraxin domain-containing protein 1-like, partial [Episyrphus balteatus]|uniref:sushi, von Willebrand factor type A, EGF and pentraxin domain-containing protein 1-like n=1 Tax=Episyrphus balteatus TaxID=286459 RepID=UPI002486C47F